MIDFIGDIHGYADQLEELLNMLGYEQKNASYSHPERKVVFIGDYIDRGPKIKRTLEIVRSMTEYGSARALMGNHEYNAICFNMLNKDGRHLREHSLKNINQHCETIRQFKNDQKGYGDYINWFKTLPLFIEEENFRAVHACWDYESIDYLRSNLKENLLSENQIFQSSVKDSELYFAVEKILKGKEVRLPGNCIFEDKEGNERHEIRIKWWENPRGFTFRDISVIPDDSLPEEQLDPDQQETDFYLPDEKPVFFGHYWLTSEPDLFRSNVCCLDYSVAKNGKLVAYRMNGERQLQSANFELVNNHLIN
jgi:hypothetical protein